MTALGTDRDAGIVNVAAPHASDHRPGRRKLFLQDPQLFSLVGPPQLIKAEPVDRTHAQYDGYHQAKPGGGDKQLHE